MSDRELDFVSEEEAARLWQRAAQLQAEAARQSEVDSDDMGTDGRSDDEEATGYALAHVRAAALEAGISAEYLDAAQRDLLAERELPRVKGNTALKVMLGEQVETITVRRSMNASPDQVIKAMEEIVPNDPYRLNLVDRRGDPFAGGVLIFDIMDASFTAHGGFAGETSWADMRQVHVALRPLDDGTEVTLRGPIAWARGINALAGVLMVGAAGGVGTLLGGALGTTVGALGGAPIFAVLAAVIAAGGTGLAGLGGFIGFRKLYDYSVTKGERALEGLLGAVAVRAERGFGVSWNPAVTDGATDEARRLKPGSE